MSNSFFNSNDIITLPSETFYSCNKNLCFENDTFIDQINSLDINTVANSIKDSLNSDNPLERMLMT